MINCTCNSITMSSKTDRQSANQKTSFYTLCRTFAVQSSAHGLRRAATARSAYTRVFWIIVFSVALICCTFHCWFLVRNYLTYPRMTITEEIHADEITFPSITVCNLNILKKSYIDRQFEILRHIPKMEPRANGTVDQPDFDSIAFCYKSMDELLYGSKTVDLSDIWMSLTVTKDSLQKFGHQEEDLIIRCTYNARNCYNRTFSIVDMNAYPSPRYGLCHTISVKNTSFQNVTTPGLALGLRLTLNIERDEYLSLLSPEYGARLLVHPQGTYPTLQRGGVVLQPGTKTYVSVRMRKIDRLPWPYGDCTHEFEESPLSTHLKRTGQRELLKHRKYTYEYCQTLCRDSYLLKQCDCSEEITQGNSKFCDPCNISQAYCRSNFLRRFNRNPRSRECNKFCKPACSDIRYDLTVSRSEWPNSKHQNFILKRWPLAHEKLETMPIDRKLNSNKELNIKYIRSNFLRVHVFIQEMNYLSVKDVPAYSTSQLFADLGGCLGLYIGVSLITLLEVFELFKSIAFVVRRKLSPVLYPNLKEQVSEKSSLSIISTKRMPLKKDRGLRSTTRFTRSQQNEYTNTLNPRRISAIRPLPSPIFIKNFQNEAASTLNLR